MARNFMGISEAGVNPVDQNSANDMLQLSIAAGLLGGRGSFGGILGRSIAGGLDTYQSSLANSSRARYQSAMADNAMGELGLKKTAAARARMMQDIRMRGYGFDPETGLPLPATAGNGAMAPQTPGALPAGAQSLSAPGAALSGGYDAWAGSLSPQQAPQQAPQQPAPQTQQRAPEMIGNYRNPYAGIVPLNAIMAGLATDSLSPQELDLYKLGQGPQPEYKDLRADEKDRLRGAIINDPRLTPRQKMDAFQANGLWDQSSRDYFEQHVDMRNGRQFNTQTGQVENMPGWLNTEAAKLDIGERAKAAYDTVPYMDPDTGRPSVGTRLDIAERASRRLRGSGVNLPQMPGEMGKTAPEVSGGVPTGLSEQEKANIGTNAKVSGEINANFVNKRLPELRTAAQVAKDRLNDAAILGEINATNLTGKLAPVRAYLEGLAADFLPGGSEAAKRATDAQIFKALTTANVLLEQKEQVGPQTDQDARRFAQTFADLGNTPESNALLIAYTKAQSSLQIRKADYFERGVEAAQRKARRTGEAVDLGEVERRWRNLPDNQLFNSAEGEALRSMHEQIRLNRGIR